MRHIRALYHICTCIESSRYGIGISILSYAIPMLFLFYVYLFLYRIVSHKRAVSCETSSRVEEIAGKCALNFLDRLNSTNLILLIAIPK